MIFSSSGRAAVVAFLLSFPAMAVLPAQTTAGTNAAATPAPPPSVLDNDDFVRMQKVRQQVLGANPDLKAEEEKLKAMHASVQSQNPPPTPEQRNAMFAEWKAYQKKMRAAMLAIDPTLAPVFAELDAARKNGTAPTPFPPATK